MPEVSVPERRPRTAQQYALDWLRAAIVSGELRPGERVAQEIVAERIDISVAPVRCPMSRRRASVASWKASRDGAMDAASGRNSCDGSSTANAL